MGTDVFSLDLSQLKTLTGDDTEFIIEILEMIMDQSPEVLSKMESEFETSDFSSLGATAHKYKSSINVLGDSQLIQLMTDIELTTKDADQKEALFPLMSRFKDVCNAILDQVSSELQELKTNS